MLKAIRTIKKIKQLQKELHTFSLAFLAIQDIGLMPETEKGKAKAQTMHDVSHMIKIAYKTAGLSANEYMETATSFSASLIQSVKGDTEKAAKLADQAIIDMSDNANKMGSSMESIQNAYQGFAKQNYTMLDNLKLGRKAIAEGKPSENDETLSKAA